MVVKELGHAALAYIRVVAFLETLDELLDVEVGELVFFIAHFVQVDFYVLWCEYIVLNRLFIRADTLQKLLNHAPLILKPKPTKTVDHLPHAKLRLRGDLLVILHHFQKV